MKSNCIRLFGVLEYVAGVEKENGRCAQLPYYNINIDDVFSPLRFVYANVAAVQLGISNKKIIFYFLVLIHALSKAATCSFLYFVISLLFALLPSMKLERTRFEKYLHLCFLSVCYYKLGYGKEEY